MKTKSRVFYPGECRVDRVEGSERLSIAGVAAVIYDGRPETEYRLAHNVVERFAPGAFDGVPGRDDVRALFNHDDSQLLGRSSAGTLELTARPHGLEYRTTPPDTPHPIYDSVAAMISRGDVSGSSLQFTIRPEDQELTEEGGQIIRTIRRASIVWDVGPATFPAYDGTQATLRHLGDADAILAEIERWQAERSRLDRHHRERHLRLIALGI